MLGKNVNAHIGNAKKQIQKTKDRKKEIISTNDNDDDDNNDSYIDAGWMDGQMNRCIDK